MPPRGAARDVKLAATMPYGVDGDEGTQRFQKLRFVGNKYSTPTEAKLRPNPHLWTPEGCKVGGDDAVIRPLSAAVTP